MLAEADPKLIANIRVRLQRAVYGRGVSFTQLFEEIDLDGNGFLELDEFVACVRDLLKLSEQQAPESALSAVFNYIDIDGSGSATMKELVDFLVVDRVLDLVVHKLEGASYRNGGKSMAKLFNRCDTDRSGTLSHHEFIRAVRTVMRVPPAEANDLQVLTLYEVIDQPPLGNGDGDISIDEMVAFLESKMAAKQPAKPKDKNKDKIDIDDDAFIQEKISLQRRSPLRRLYDELCVSAILQHRIREEFVQTSATAPTHTQTTMTTSSRLLTFGDMEVGLMGMAPGAPPESCHIIADENALVLALRLWLVTDYKKMESSGTPRANKSSHRRLSAGLVALHASMDNGLQSESGAALIGIKQLRAGLKNIELELCRCYLLSAHDDEPYRFTGHCIAPTAIECLFKVLCPKKGKAFMFESLARLMLDALLNSICVSDDARNRIISNRDPKEKLFQEQKEQQELIMRYPAGSLRAQNLLVDLFELVEIMRDAIAADEDTAKAPLSSTLEAVAKTCGVKEDSDDTDTGSLLSQSQVLRMLQELRLVDGERTRQWEIERDRRGCPWGYEEATVALKELFFANATGTSIAAWPATLLTREQYQQRVVADVTEERLIHFNALVIRGFQALQLNRTKIQTEATRSGLDIQGLRTKFAPEAGSFERADFLRNGLRHAVQSYVQIPSFQLRRRVEKATAPPNAMNVKRAHFQHAFNKDAVWEYILNAPTKKGWERIGKSTNQNESIERAFANGDDISPKINIGTKKKPLECHVDFSLDELINIKTQESIGKVSRRTANVHHAHDVGGRLVVGALALKKKRGRSSSGKSGRGRRGSQVGQKRRPFTIDTSVWLLQPQLELHIAEKIPEPEEAVIVVEAKDKDKPPAEKAASKISSLAGKMRKKSIQNIPQKEVKPEVKKKTKPAAAPKKRNPKSVKAEEKAKTSVPEPEPVIDDSWKENLTVFKGMHRAVVKFFNDGSRPLSKLVYWDSVDVLLQDYDDRIEELYDKLESEYGEAPVFDLVAAKAKRNAFKGLKPAMEKFFASRSLKTLGVASVPELLEEYEDREDELYHKLESQFGAVPDFDLVVGNATANAFKRLQLAMENFFALKAHSLKKVGAKRVEELLYEYAGRENELYQKLSMAFGKTPEFDVSGAKAKARANAQIFKDVRKSMVDFFGLDPESLEKMLQIMGAESVDELLHSYASREEELYDKLKAAFGEVPQFDVAAAKAKRNAFKGLQNAMVKFFGERSVETLGADNVNALLDEHPNREDELFQKIQNEFGAMPDFDLVNAKARSAVFKGFQAQVVKFFGVEEHSLEDLSEASVDDLVYDNAGHEDKLYKRLHSEFGEVPMFDLDTAKAKVHIYNGMYKAMTKFFADESHSLAQVGAASVEELLHKYEGRDEELYEMLDEVFDEEPEFDVAAAKAKRNALKGLAKAVTSFFRERPLERLGVANVSELIDEYHDREDEMYEKIQTEFEDVPEFDLVGAKAKANAFKDLHTEMVSFFATGSHSLEGLDTTGVDELLHKYAGRETQLYKMLEKEFGEVPEFDLKAAKTQVAVSKGVQKALVDFFVDDTRSVETLGAANVEELLHEYEGREEELYEKLQSDFGEVPSFDVAAAKSNPVDDDVDPPQETEGESDVGPGDSAPPDAAPVAANTSKNDQPKAEDNASATGSDTTANVDKANAAEQAPKEATVQAPEPVTEIPVAEALNMGEDDQVGDLSTARSARSVRSYPFSISEVASEMGDSTTFDFDDECILLASAHPGDTVLIVDDTEGRKIGECVIINEGEDTEEKAIVAGLGQLELQSGIKFFHNVGEVIGHSVWTAEDQAANPPDPVDEPAAESVGSEETPEAEIASQPKQDPEPQEEANKGTEKVQDKVQSKGDDVTLSHEPAGAGGAAAVDTPQEQVVDSEEKQQTLTEPVHANTPAKVEASTPEKTKSSPVTLEDSSVAVERQQEDPEDREQHEEKWRPQAEEETQEKEDETGMLLDCLKFFTNNCTFV